MCKDQDSAFSVQQQQWQQQQQQQHQQSRVVLLACPSVQPEGGEAGGMYKRKRRRRRTWTGGTPPFPPSQSPPRSTDILTRTRRSGRFLLSFGCALGTSRDEPITWQRPPNHAQRVWPKRIPCISYVHGVFWGVSLSGETLVICLPTPAQK